MKHEKCYLCLRTRVTLVPGPYNGGGTVGGDRIAYFRILRSVYISESF